MDFNNKTLLLIIVFISSLLLSSHALSPSFSPLEIDSLFKEAVEASQGVFKPEPEVVEFCSGTENPTLCAVTIAPYFQDTFDPMKALEAEVEATLNRSLKVVGIITKLLSNSKTDKKTRKALYICNSKYKNIVYTIKEAKELLNQQNVVDAYYKFNYVLSYRSACEDAFLECSGVEIPFGDDSFILSQLGGNCMAIMDGIVNSHTVFF